MAIRNVVTRGYGPGATIAFVVTRGFSFGVGAPSVDIGALSLSELQVTDGGQVITITLQNDIWQPAGNAFDQVRQIILNGMNSAQSENTGWNREVRDKQPITAVVRTSNTVVTVTLAAAPDYDITVNETITVTVPPEALITSITALVAPSTIGITADAAIVDSHIVRFRSAASAVVVIRDTPQPLGFFLTEDGNNMVQESGLLLALESTLVLQRIDFKSAANATTVIVDTLPALGFILTEDGGILQQENNLPIAQE